jgi:lipid-A-disaccharide synthase-like uncharacterized protein
MNAFAIKNIIMQTYWKLATLVQYLTQKDANQSLVPFAFIFLVWLQ